MSPIAQTSLRTACVVVALHLLSASLTSLALVRPAIAIDAIDTVIDANAALRDRLRLPHPQAELLLSVPVQNETDREFPAPRFLQPLSNSEPQEERSFASRPLLSARLIEMPREHRPGQGYTRPRYAVGFRSNSMKSWLQGMGVDARSCLAPVMRLRTRLSSDGDFSGTLWVHARCSFD